MFDDLLKIPDSCLVSGDVASPLRIACIARGAKRNDEATPPETKHKSGAFRTHRKRAYNPYEKKKTLAMHAITRWLDTLLEKQEAGTPAGQEVPRRGRVGQATGHIAQWQSG